jgi:FixJ family two-component response regulator
MYADGRGAAIMMANRIVAIVEDDPGMLNGVGRLLNAHGFVTELYTSAEAFLERAASSQARCLVLDIHLGGISGIELRRRLAAAASKVPVVFMTGVDSDLLRTQATEAGCVDFLRKPFSARQLIDAIDKAVG